jgi:hypothetical protein
MTITKPKKSVTIDGRTFRLYHTCETKHTAVYWKDMVKRNRDKLARVIKLKVGYAIYTRIR